LNDCEGAPDSLTGVRGLGVPFALPEGRRRMSLWLLILIIVIVVLALGGFGYSRRV
jgi:hypothetical protein